MTKTDFSIAKSDEEELGLQEGVVFFPRLGAVAVDANQGEGDRTKTGS